MGDDDHVRGTFPDLRKDHNRHEHRDPDPNWGGLFYHSHPRGSVPHTHGPRGGFRKVSEAEQQAQGDEQHDRAHMNGHQGSGL